MPGGIYLIREDDQLVEMSQQKYDSEELLQKLLAQYPHLLAGDQMNEAEPRRWLLVAREVGLASDEHTGERWSVDHLFLDQDAVPTLVEVKRSTDTRIRREVVGQMLEYAANAVLYWPVDSIRRLFEDTCRKHKKHPSDELVNLLGPEPDEAKFWENVSTNMKASRIRLVFVADEVPLELRRIVEFLGQQMSTTQVFALEIKQYAGQNLKSLVPRVFGGQSKQKSKQWDESTFFPVLAKRHGPEQARVARSILDWGRDRSLQIRWGRGANDGSFSLAIDNGPIQQWLAYVWSSGSVQVPFEYMMARAPFDDEQLRRELLQRLNCIPGVSLSVAVITKSPGIKLSVLRHETALAKLLEAFDWFIQHARSADYSAERSRVLGDPTVDELVAQIEKQRKDK